MFFTQVGFSMFLQELFKNMQNPIKDFWAHVSEQAWWRLIMWTNSTGETFNVSCSWTWSIKLGINLKTSHVQRVNEPMLKKDEHTNTQNKLCSTKRMCVGVFCEKWTISYFSDWWVRPVVKSQGLFGENSSYYSTSLEGKATVCRNSDHMDTFMGAFRNALNG